MDRSFTRVAITPPYFYPDEASSITRLLDSQLFDYVHIRKPDASDDEVSRLIESINPALRPHLTVHYHHTVAATTRCGGIHLSANRPEKPEGWTGRVSRSCHSLDEIRQAEPCDYIFLSPVYPSISKPGYRSALLADPGLPSALSATPTPVVALGGVTAAELPYLQTIGFKGAAMLGDAWRSPAMKLSRFALQLITHPYPGLSVISGAQRALAGGCRWIQLRHKDADPATMIAEAHAIAALREHTDFTFILDDHVDLVEIAGADGVHLGKNDMSVAEARRILGPGKIIGATANTIDDIRRAASAGADYIGLGPFRFTSTKKNLSPVLGLEGYREIITTMRSEGLRLPVVAIGGITLPDVSHIIEAGADGIAVSGAILGSADPEVATVAFINELSNPSINDINRR